MPCWRRSYQVDMSHVPFPPPQTRNELQLQKLSHLVSRACHSSRARHGWARNVDSDCFYFTEHRLFLMSTLRRLFLLMSTLQMLVIKTLEPEQIWQNGFDLLEKPMWGWQAMDLQTSKDFYRASKCAIHSGGWHLDVDTVEDPHASTCHPYATNDKHLERCLALLCSSLIPKCAT